METRFNNKLVFVRLPPNNNPTGLCLGGLRVLNNPCPAFGFTKTSFFCRERLEMATFMRYGNWFPADFYPPIFIFLNHIKKSILVLAIFT